MTTFEINALVAEKVLGWEGRKIVYRWDDRKKKSDPMVMFEKGGDSIGDFGTFVDEEGNKIQYGKPHRVYFPLDFSNNISAAWRVFETVVDDHPNADVAKTKHGYICIFQIGTDEETQTGIVVEAEAPTAPEAICLAALKVRGVEVNV